MVAAYVCFSCRRELQRRVPNLSRAQCTPKASFISLTNVVPPTKEQEQQTTPAHPFQRPLPTNERSESHLGAPKHGQRHHNPKLEELFANKDATTQPGRYSRGRIQQQPMETLSTKDDEEGEMRINNLQNLRLHQHPESRHSRSVENMTDVQRVNTSEQIQYNPLIEKTSRHRKAESFKQSPRPLANTPAAALDSLLNDDTKDAKDVWAFFEEHYARKNSLSTALQSPNLQDGAYLTQGAIFQRVLLHMTKSWDVKLEDSKTPCEVIQALQDANVMRPSFYVDVLWELVARAFQSNSQKNDPMSATILREQILQVWALIFRVCGKQELRDPNYVQEGKIDWMGLPDKEKMAFPPRPDVDTRDLGYRIFGHLSNMSATYRSSLAAVAIATVDTLFRDFSNLNASENFSTDYEPFLLYVLRLLLRSSTGKTVEFLRKRSNISETQIQAVLSRLKDAPFRANLALGSGSLEVFADDTVELNPGQQTRYDSHMASRVGKHLEMKQIGPLMRLWEQCQESSRPLGSIMYDNLIIAFDKLGRPDKTIEVWNHMISHGVKPTPAQWFALLRGRSRNPEAMDQVWRRMTSAGVQPDLHAWNTRISSLLMWAPHAEQGLSALDDMTKAWLAAVEKEYPTKTASQLTKKSVPHVDKVSTPTVRPKWSEIGDLLGAPKPGVSTLNSCISGLTKRRFGKHKRVDLIPQVFRWANELGINANVITFNTLINTVMNDGNMKEAMQLMKQMEKQGIEPDVATFNIFLTHVFKTKNEESQMTTEQQQNAIVSILDLVDAHGLEMGEYLFSSLIDGLLKSHNNLAQAQLVFDQMLARKIKVRPHVWTSFLTYYFQQADDPTGPGVPNLPAIESLWENILASGAIVDNIFYDRMIEGYAKCGEVGQAMTFLTRMSKEAKKPSWPCLTAVVRALLDKGWDDRAAEIVHDVENSEGLFPHGVLRDHQKINPDRDMFWEIVTQAGLRSMELLQDTGNSASTTI